MKLDRRAPWGYCDETWLRALCVEHGVDPDDWWRYYEPPERCHRRCEVITRRGSRCINSANLDGIVCRVHAARASEQQIRARKVAVAAAFWIGATEDGDFGWAERWLGAAFALAGAGTRRDA